MSRKPELYKVLTGLKKIIKGTKGRLHEVYNEPTEVVNMSNRKVRENIKRRYWEAAWEKDPTKRSFFGLIDPNVNTNLPYYERNPLGLTSRILQLYNNINRSEYTRRKQLKNQLMRQLRETPSLSAIRNKTKNNNAWRKSIQNQARKEAMIKAAHEKNIKNFRNSQTYKNDPDAGDEKIEAMEREYYKKYVEVDPYNG